MTPIEEAEGVFRLPLYSPFPTGPTNVYVLVGERLGLFDTGIALERTWEELVAGLRALGQRPDEVEVVVISHAHLDHQGQVERFPQAEVLVGGADLPAVLDAPGQEREHLAVIGGLFPRWGVPAEEGAEILEFFEKEEWHSSAPWAGPLEDGRLLTGLGPDLVALSTPGHTPGSVCLIRPTDGLLLAGDHLLPRITPVPGLYTGRAPVRSGLFDYFNSLTRLLTFEVQRVLPGHGEPFSFASKRINEIFGHHEERLQRVRELAAGGLTVFALASQLFGVLDPLNRYLALRESIGHLQMLEDKGELRLITQGGTDVYRPF